MRPQQIPISYAKINPSGQLIVGLEDGTILNAGYVYGPSGPTGPMGPCGIIGPTGVQGASVTTLKTFNDKLYYTIENKTFIAGSLPYITGPTGRSGTSVERIYIDNKGNLHLLSNNGQDFNVGYIYGPTGVQGPLGPPGPLGPTGMNGKPFTISRMQTINNRLIVIDDMNKSYDCGLIAVSGITGPPGYYDTVYTTDDGYLVFTYGDNIINAGCIKGNTGPRGHTGVTGPIGPLNIIKECCIENSKLIITDIEGNKTYSVGDSLIGPTGYTGPKGERGPIGKMNAIRNANINEYGQLVLIDYSNKVYTTTGTSLISKIPGPTGSTGPPITVEVEQLEDNVKLSINNKVVHIYGPTGTTGCTGPIGPTGIRGLRGTTGSMGHTGSTGPKYSFSNISATGHILIFTDTNSTYNIEMPRGDIGPTGTTGPMLQLKEISIKDGDKLCLIDINDNVYTTSGSLPRGPCGKIKNVYTKDTSLCIVDYDDTVFIIDNLQGPQGNTGPTGPIGTMKNVKVIDNVLYMTDGITEFCAGYITSPTGPTGPKGEMCSLKKVITSSGKLTLIDNFNNIVTSDTDIYGPTGPRGPTGCKGVGIDYIKENIVYTTDKQKFELIVPTGPTGPVGTVIVSGQVTDGDLTLVLENGNRILVEGCIAGPTGPMGYTGPKGIINPYQGTGVFGTNEFGDDIHNSYNVIIDSLRRPSSYYPTHFGLGLHTSLYSTPDYTSIVIGNHLCDNGPNNGSNAVSIGNYSGQIHQGKHAIAIGFCAGYDKQHSYSIAIGEKAARYGQGIHSLAIGYKAGFKSCQSFSNCIGFRTEAPHANVNVLNATSNSLSSTHTNSTFIKPIRKIKPNQSHTYTQLYYDEDTGELVIFEP